MEDVAQFLANHWPIVTFAVAAAMVTQVAKAAVWTQKRAEGGGRAAGFCWWMRKTLSLHPVVAGALFGLIPGLPASPDVPETMAAHALYYGGAGVLSTWVFAIVKGLAKRRGIEIEIEPPEAGE
jgi:hypothetical protein